MLQLKLPNAVTPCRVHSGIVLVIDIHHANTLRIDRFESNADCCCLGLTVINVALNPGDLNAFLNVLSRLSYDVTGV